VTPNALRVEVSHTHLARRARPGERTARPIVEETRLQHFKGILAVRFRVQGKITAFDIKATLPESAAEPPCSAFDACQVPCSREELLPAAEAGLTPDRQEAQTLIARQNRVINLVFTVISPSMLDCLRLENIEHY